MGYKCFLYIFNDENLWDDVNARLSLYLLFEYRNKRQGHTVQYILFKQILFVFVKRLDHQQKEEEKCVS